MSRRPSSRSSFVLAFALCAGCATSTVTPDAGTPEDAGLPSQTDAGSSRYDCPPGEAWSVLFTECRRAGPQKCPRGFTPHSTGWGCEPILPAQPCGAGTHRVLGETSCVAVQVQLQIPEFRRHPSGWGAEAVTAASCEGATRRALGSALCVPLGDCTAAFPPADATVFVDPAFSDAQLNATHHRTVNAALTAAAAGAVISLADGTYREALRPSRPVTLVGRCAARAFLQGEGVTAGVYVSGVQGVQLRGLTLSEHRTAVFATAGASVSLRDVLLERNVESGLFVGRASQLVAQGLVIRDTQRNASGTLGTPVFVSSGARAQLTDVELGRFYRAGVVARDASTTVELSRAVISDGQPAVTGTFAGTAGYGITVVGEARAKLDSALLHRNTTAGVHAERGGKVESRHLVVEQTRANARFESAGVLAANDGWLVLEDTTLSGNVRHGVRVEGTGYLESRRLVVRDTKPPATSSSAAAVSLSWTSLQLDDAALVDNLTAGVRVEGLPARATLNNLLVLRSGDVGVSVGEEGRLVVDGCSLEGNAGANADASEGGELELTRCILQGNVVLPGVAHPTASVLLMGSGRAALTDSWVTGSRGHGVELDGEHDFLLGRAGLRLRGVVLDRTQPVDGRGGIGVLARGDSVVHVLDSQLAGNDSAQLVVLPPSRATLEQTLLGGAKAGAASPGMGAVIHGTAELTESALHGAAAVALLVSGADADVQLRSVALLHTDGEGHALVSERGATVTGHGLSIQDNAGAGALASSGTLRVADSLLRRNRVAFQVQGSSVLAGTVDAGVPWVELAPVLELEGNAVEHGEGLLEVPRPRGFLP